MELNQILIEDFNGIEKNFSLYDKILFKNQNIFIYLNEEKCREYEFIFLKYDGEDQSLSEDITGYEELIQFYNQLNS